MRLGGQDMSYLAWTASINGRMLDARDKPLHITCKFFGNLDISLGTIQTLLHGLDPVPVNFRDQPRWQPSVLGDGKMKAYALELLNPPARMVACHRAFSAIRPEDFPTWRPHISMDKGLWDFLQTRSPGNTFVECGPLMLMGLT